MTRRIEISGACPSARLRGSKTRPLGRPSRDTQRVLAASAVLLAGGVLLGSLGGCKTSTSGIRPADAYVAPEWTEQNIRSLAFLGLANSVGDPASVREAQAIVQEMLLGGQDRFLVLGFTEAQRRARAGGAEEAFDKVVRVWRDNRIADPFLVQQVSRAIGVDGLIVGSLLEWQRERVDRSLEGSSSTQVALSLNIFSGSTGKPVWEAEKTHRKETLTYTPTQAGSGGYSDPTPASRGQVALTPDPPRPEVVAREAMEALLAALPPRPAGS